MTEQRQSRRDFLKAGAAAAAGATVLNLAPYVFASGSDAIKVGLVGCGGRGSGACANVLRAAPNVEIVAIGDAFKFRVDRLRQSLLKSAETEEIKKLDNKVNLPEDRCFVGLDAYEKVISHPEVNYVILATPPGFRPLHLQTVVAAGKNVFTEKPVAVDGPGIRKVFDAYDAAMKKGLHIGVGTQRRHQSSYLEAMKRVHGGEIGEITALRCYWNNTGIWFRPRSELAKQGLPDTDLAYQLHNWYHFLWVCGDHIVEQHIHNIDACNWAMGNQHPVRCIGVGSRSARPGTGGQYNPGEHGNIFDQFCIDFEYENGVHMLSMCRHIPGSDNLVCEEMIGTKGMCHTQEQRDRQWIKGATNWTNEGPNNVAMDQEHTDLIASIRENKPYNELKHVAETTLTAIMGRMAAYTGKSVTWDRALNSTLDTFPQQLAFRAEVTALRHQLNSTQDTFPTQLSWDMNIETPSFPVPGRTPLV